MKPLALSDIMETTGLFYYITMKEYERKDRKKRKKKNPIKVRRVIPSEKKLLMMKSKRKEVLNQFDLSLLKEEIPNLPLPIESYDELFLFLSQLDIGKCFSPAIPLDTYIPCRLFHGNYAWISRNQYGHYRYFSKNEKEQDVISFDLLDFVEIYFGFNTVHAIEKIVKVFNIKFMEDLWKKEKKQKYFRNEQFIHLSIAQYPSLFTILSNHLPVLEILNFLGNIHIYKKEYSYKNENLFFASTSYISSFLSTNNTSKINQLINLFSTLGFIEKVPTSSIPPILLKQSAEIVDRRYLGNRINYFIIHSFEKVAPIAESRAKILLDHGIRHSRISKATIQKLFGAEFAQTIYPQTIQKNKKRATNKKENIEAQLEENFHSLLIEQGYVTKTMVASMPVFDLSLSKKQSYLKKMWSYLLNKYNCAYTKPTKQMKEQYDLPSFEYIAYQRK